MVGASFLSALVFPTRRGYALCVAVRHVCTACPFLLLLLSRVRVGLSVCIRGAQHVHTCVCVCARARMTCLVSRYKTDPAQASTYFRDGQRERGGIAAGNSTSKDNPLGAYAAMCGR